MEDNTTTDAPDIEGSIGETSYAGTLDVGEEGGVKTGGQALALEIGDEGAEPTGLAATSGEETEEGEPEATTEELGEENPEDPEGAEEDAPALPEAYDAENEETVAAFDKAYLSEDGSPNLQAFTQEFDGNGGLKPATYDYLEHTFKLDKAGVDRIIAGQVALRETHNQAVYAKVPGGKDAFTGMMAWADKNYTPEQRAAFDAAYQNLDADLDDQLTLLQARYGRANGKGLPAPQQQPGGPRLRRQASPKRSATQTSNPSAAAPAQTVGVEPFASHEELRKAQREAGDNPAAHKKIEARLKASPKLIGRVG